MPNWNSNRLDVSGPRKDVAKFKEKAKRKRTKSSEASAFSLQSLIPMPKALEETTSPPPKPNSKANKALKAKYGYCDWYDWHLANWGVKWDVTAAKPAITQLTYGETLLEYDFDSPWGPPDTAVRKIAALFPTLRFHLEYCEPGMAFSGLLIIDRGEVLQDEYYEGKVWDEFKDDALEEDDLSV